MLLSVGAQLLLHSYRVLTPLPISARTSLQLAPSGGKHVVQACTALVLLSRFVTLASTWLFFRQCALVQRLTLSLVRRQLLLRLPLIDFSGPLLIAYGFCESCVVHAQIDLKACVPFKMPQCVACETIRPPQTLIVQRFALV